MEGPEGAGKSTQLRELASWVRQLGCEVVVTREPGGTPSGDRIRQVLFASADSDLLPLTEAFPALLALLGLPAPHRRATRAPLPVSIPEISTEARRDVVAPTV